MPPRRTAPAEEPKPKRKGIEVNYEYQASMPNWIMNPCYWQPKDGGRPPSVYAMLCYMWCMDKVTSIYDVEDYPTLDAEGNETIGTVPMGQVLGGTPVSYSTIARNLHISWKTVQRQMEYLASVGLIRRFRGNDMQEYSFEVVRCRKPLTSKQADGSIKMGGKKYKKKEPSINPEDEDDLGGDDESTFTPEPPAPLSGRFVCPYCNAVADSAPALLKHQIEVHNEFDCVYCDCIFGQKKALTDHLVKEHGWALASNGLYRPPKPA